MKKKKFYRPDEAAEILRYNRRTIYRLIAAGELLGFSRRKGAAVLIPAESLDAFVERNLENYQAENGIFVTGDDGK